MGDISLGGGCFRQFAPAWHKKNFQLFTIEGLNDHVFFEGKGKGIYIDVNYWSGRRVSHLFHKVAFQVQAVQSQFAVMLALDPVTEVLPLVIEVQKYLEQPLTSQLKRWFTGNLRPLDKAFSKINEESCRIRLQKIGRFGESKIQKIWEEMRSHLFTKVLAQTLDVVGLIEFITQQDLLSTERFHPNEITQLSPEVKEVLLVASKLKL